MYNITVTDLTSKELATISLNAVLVDGVGVQTLEVSEEGDLLVTKTNGEVVDAGFVIGPQGEVGPQGPKGDRGDDGDSVTIKASIPTVDQLPGAGNKIGDLYVVLENGLGFVFNEAGGWDSVGQFIGPQGNPGEVGPQGPVGQGVIPGGQPGQVLVKVDGTDYNTQWIDPPITGLQSLEEDTAPKLSGSLDTADQIITNQQVDGDVKITTNGSGRLVVNDQAFPKNDGQAGQILRTNGSGDLFWDDEQDITHVNENEPQVVEIGDQWFNPTTQILKIYTAAGWVQVTADDLQF